MPDLKEVTVDRKNTPQERELATRFVLRQEGLDDSEKNELLQMLGLT